MSEEIILEVISVVFKTLMAIKDAAQEVKVLRRLSRQLMNRTLAFKGRLHTLYESPKMYEHFTEALKEFEVTVNDVYDFIKKLSETSKWRIVFSKASIVEQYHQLQDRLDRCRDDLQFEIILNQTNENQALEDDLQDVFISFLREQSNDMKQIMIDLVETLREKKVGSSRVINDVKLVLENTDKDPELVLKEKLGNEIALLVIDETRITKLGDVVGSGGFGLIYRGRYSKADVAIKCLRKENNVISDFEKNSLLDEVRLQNKCSFKYVAHMYGYCHIDNKLFAVMDYATCGSLGSFLHYGTGHRGELAIPGQGSLVIPVDVVIMLLYEIALGMEFIHSKCVIHRDIKPSNILLDASLTPKLTDFGLSKELKTIGIHSHTGNVGTFHYMAPEVMIAAHQGSSKTTRQYTYTADVYSFGVVILEMCHRLYGEGRWDFLSKDIDLPDCFPSALNEIKNRCIDQNPNHRYGRDSDDGSPLEPELEATMNCSGGSPRDTFGRNKGQESRLSFLKICDAAARIHVMCKNESHQGQKSSTKTYGTEQTQYSFDSHNKQGKNNTNNPLSNQYNDNPDSTTESENRRSCFGIHPRLIKFGALLFGGIIILVIIVRMSGTNPPSSTTAPTFSSPTVSPTTSTPTLRTVSLADTSGPSVVPTIHPSASLTASPTTAPTDRPTDQQTDPQTDSPIICFQSTEELRKAIGEYNIYGSSTAQYGYPMNNWCVGQVTDFSYLLDGMADFNEPIGSWDTSSAITMKGMFRGATTFNQDISAWNTASVQDMSWMFQGASSFNWDISPWVTSSVTSTEAMFLKAASFDQDLSTWDIKSVTDMSGMFSEASSFSQNLCDWFDNLNPSITLTQSDGSNGVHLMFPYTKCEYTPEPDLQTKTHFCNLCA